MNNVQQIDFSLRVALIARMLLECMGQHDPIVIKLTIQRIYDDLSELKRKFEEYEVHPTK